ncbi:MAG: hypothetical protein JNK82_32695 [Myxococcaceae bacterium]|nr:hypothetical protein [Myxococcaceae bacterium]
MNRIVCVSLCVLATACGPKEPSRVATGSYTAHASSELTDAKLDIDVTAKTATLTPKNGAAIALTLTAVPEASWPTACPTNTSSTVVEVYTVSPDPLTAGTMSITAPKLKAGCGIDGANPSQVMLEGTSGEFSVGVLVNTQ